MERSTRWSSMWVAVALAMAGCGGPGSFHGTVGGMTLDVKDSLFFAMKDSGGQISALALVMTSKPGLCEAMKNGSILGNMTYAGVVLGQTSSGQNQVPTPGDFTVTNGSSGLSKLASIFFTQTDATCHHSLDERGAAGTVTLSQYKAEANGTMNGTFDATFSGAGDRATGDFNADFCDAPLGASGCQ